MLATTHAAFPAPGSYALLPDPPQRYDLVHIVSLRGDDALVSFPAKPKVASGNRSVPLADLRGGLPLSESERAEMVEIERAVHGRKRTKRREPQFARLDTLLEREFLAHLLAFKLRAAGLAPVDEAA